MHVTTQSTPETIDHSAMAMFIMCIEVHNILKNQHAQGRIHIKCFGNKTTLVASSNGVFSNCFPNVRHLEAIALLITTSFFAFLLC